MTTNLEPLMNALFILLMAVTSIYLLMMHRLLTLLRDRHSEVWERLGSPHLILNNRPEHTVHLLRFLWSREGKTLQDARVWRIVRWTRTFFILSLVCLMFGLGLGLAIFLGLAFDGRRQTPLVTHVFSGTYSQSNNR